MKGDFTRSTFKPDKHYSGVRMQQGRVQLDADWNEQVDIGTHRVETEAVDVIGGCGAPMHNAGFKLTDGPIPKISKGRYYVDGILCENDADVDLDKQLDLPVAALRDVITPRNVAVPDGLYIAYLDVWQRHITALEDDGIREVALGGPDTATRTKTVWQVRLLGPLPAPLTCVSEPTQWMNLLDRTQNGKLTARAEESNTARGLCMVPPSAGYRRLENQLYRVEIHEVDAGGTITLLKWSRDNGSIVTRWLDQKLSKREELIVSSIGRDDVLNFAPGQFVETIDDQRELRGEAGILIKLANAEDRVLTLDTADPNAATVLKTNFPDQIAGRPNHPKVRRWDGIVSKPGMDTWFELENGVQIRFENGKKHHAGDYWLIPARTATTDVEWPRDAANLPIPQPRLGIEHHYCKLGILERTTGSFKFSDCRKLFPPLTELTTLLYESGDGQEARPNELLQHSLSVRVVNGQAPVIDAKVKFTVETGNGSLSVAQPVATLAPDGIASCGWTLGNAASGTQRVQAKLLDAAGTPVPGQVLHFNATLNLDILLYVGGDGQEAMPGTPLSQTLRVRVINGQAPVNGAKVQFTLRQGGGNLPVAAPVTTGNDGIAECSWTLGITGTQVVDAILLDAIHNPVPGQIVRFGANVSVANQVAYDPSHCSNLAGANTVQDAIDILCRIRQGGCCVCVGKGGDYERLDEALKELIEKGERDICICLLHGDQEIGGIDIESRPGDRDLNIEIVGCGPGSRVTLHAPLRFLRVNSVVLRDFAIETAFIAETGGVLAFERCAEVSLRTCRLSGFTTEERGALLFIAGADRVRLDDNVFEALLPDSLLPTRLIFEKIGMDQLAKLYSLPDQGELRRTVFRRAALRVAERLAKLDIGARRELREKLFNEISSPEQRALQSRGEMLGYGKLTLELAAEEMNPGTAFDLLLDIWRIALKTRPGTAIILERPRKVAKDVLPELQRLVDTLDNDGFHLLEGNDIAGILSLYGPPAPLPFVEKALSPEVRKNLLKRLSEQSINLNNVFLGTLQVRGNQLVRVAVGREIVEELNKAAGIDQKVNFALDLFGRCLWDGNVIEGGRSLLVCRHLTMDANEFNKFVQPSDNNELVAGTLVADSSIYVANHGRRTGVILRNLSRLIEQVANQELAILS